MMMRALKLCHSRATRRRGRPEGRSAKDGPGRVPPSPGQAQDLRAAPTPGTRRYLKGLRSLAWEDARHAHAFTPDAPKIAKMLPTLCEGGFVGLSGTTSWPSDCPVEWAQHLVWPAIGYELISAATACSSRRPSRSCSASPRRQLTSASGSSPRSTPPRRGDPRRRRLRAAEPRGRWRSPLRSTRLERYEAAR
jgi:hypothetical protein